MASRPDRSATLMTALRVLRNSPILRGENLSRRLKSLLGVIRLMLSDYKEPLNIGSDEMVSMNDMAAMALEFAGRSIVIVFLMIL